MCYSHLVIQMVQQRKQKTKGRRNIFGFWFHQKRRKKVNFFSSYGRVWVVVIEILGSMINSDLC